MVPVRRMRASAVPLLLQVRVGNRLAHSSRAFALFRTLGAAYLGYLGVRSLRAAFASAPAPLEISAAPRTDAGSPRLLLTGFLCNVLNPKAMVFYAALLPQFLRPADPVFLTSIGLTSIHWCEGMAWLGFLTLSLDRVRTRLLDPRTLRILEGSTGLLLTGLAARMGLEHLIP